MANFLLYSFHSKWKNCTARSLKKKRRNSVDPWVEQTANFMSLISISRVNGLVFVVHLGNFWVTIAQ
jgi:hypothetical protein